MLLEYKADVNSHYREGIPLFNKAIFDSDYEALVRRPLKHRADKNRCNNDHSAPLHLASSKGFLEVASLLLSYGVKVDEKGGMGPPPRYRTTMYRAPQGSQGSRAYGRHRTQLYVDDRRRGMGGNP